MSEILLDVKGLNCPLPILRAKKALARIEVGQSLRVLATDPAAPQDFAAFCLQIGQALESSTEDGGIFSFVIRRVK